MRSNSRPESRGRPYRSRKYKIEKLKKARENAENACSWRKNWQAEHSGEAAAGGPRGLSSQLPLDWPLESGAGGVRSAA